jgi:hypothetical protein
MAVFLRHNGLTIEMFDDTAFTQLSDSPVSYDNVYQADKDKDYEPISQHAIIVYKNNIKQATAILLAAAGATSVTEDSVIIEDNNLITRCCNNLFSLTLPDLHLNWIIQVDWATCFSIHKYKDDFITHGEMSIKRVDKNGKIIWDYGGADIFVTHDGSSSFDMLNNCITAKDFNGSIYKIDYDGKTIKYSESNSYKKEPVTVLFKSKKSWWKFWQR